MGAVAGYNLVPVWLKAAGLNNSSAYKLCSSLQQMMAVTFGVMLESYSMQFVIL